MAMKDKTHDMTNFVLDHSRQECLQSPEMSQGIHAKGSDGAVNFRCTKEVQNDELIDILWLEIDDEFSLHNACVIDEHSGLTDLQWKLNVSQRTNAGNVPRR